MRFFNTEGPNRPSDHYCLPPLQRWDLDEVLALIAQKKYFLLHAPRQTGKTSCLLALMVHLNRAGPYRAAYANLEVAQPAREDVDRGMAAICSVLGRSIRLYLQDPSIEAWIRAEGARLPGEDRLTHLLAFWASVDPRPAVLLLDEVDALIGDTLVSLLRQLRAGYPQRPSHFPSTVVLCGVRDLRDYRIHARSEAAPITGGSAFNIKAKSLRLGDFSEADTRALLREHTTETGQVFTEAALARVWTLTQGQPWLVNALAYRVCFEMPEGRDRTQPITPALIDQAKEALILERVTHLDQLADKLREPRVRQVVEAILVGDQEPTALPMDDIDYVRDLGLIRAQGQLEIANPIYREVVPRQLTYGTQLTISEQPAWYVRPEGRLDLPKLLAAFQQFFREHSESWIERFDYKEAGPQLLMQAFLQRIVNGGGRVEREYGLGRRRTDLLLIWPHAAGPQRAVIELKLLHRGLERTLADGLEQTWAYADASGADEAHLVIFDRRPGSSWEEKIWRREEHHHGRVIQVWGC